MKALLCEFCIMAVCTFAVCVMLWLGLEYGLSKLGV